MTLKQLRDLPINELLVLYDEWEDADNRGEWFNEKKKLYGWTFSNSSLRNVFQERGLYERKDSQPILQEKSVFNIDVTYMDYEPHTIKLPKDIWTALHKICEEYPLYRNQVVIAQIIKNGIKASGY